jgi:hypothetical protein
MACERHGDREGEGVVHGDHARARDAGQAEPEPQQQSRDDHHHDRTGQPGGEDLLAGVELAGHLVVVGDPAHHAEQPAAVRTGEAVEAAYVET